MDKCAVSRCRKPLMVSYRGMWLCDDHWRRYCDCLDRAESARWFPRTLLAVFRVRMEERMKPRRIKT
jgi:hypothetical protein